MRKWMLPMAAFILAITTTTWASTLQYLGSSTLPPSALSDISGLAYDINRNVYYAVSDQEGGFYTLAINLDQSGIHTIQVLGLTLLDCNPQTTGIQPCQRGEIDAEAIVLTPEDQLLVSSERGQQSNPWIRRFALNGAFLEEIPIPRKFIPVPSLSMGVREDLAFEAMTRNSTGNMLYVANEQGLQQDYELATLTRGTVVRILQYSLSARPATEIAEYAYATEPIFAVPGKGGEGENGVSEIVFVNHILPQYNLLVMERSYSSGIGYDIKLFGVALGGASNIIHSEELPCLCSTRTVKKTLLLRISGNASWSDIPVIPGNMGAMTIGPILPNGHYTLILASDNGSSTQQPTLFFAFEIVP